MSRTLTTHRMGLPYLGGMRPTVRFASSFFSAQRLKLSVTACHGLSTGCRQNCKKLRPCNNITSVSHGPLTQWHQIVSYFLPPVSWGAPRAHWADACDLALFVSSDGLAR